MLWGVRYIAYIHTCRQRPYATSVELSFESIGRGCAKG
jgi:hypothetical protein